MALSNRQKIVAFLEAIPNGGMDALPFVNWINFTQHDLAIADGIEGYHEQWAQGLAPSAIEVVRVFEDGDFVFAHSCYQFGTSKAAFDLFRFSAGEIVEHWSNFQDMVAPNPSGRTLLDGPTEVTDRERTEDNKALARDFLTTHLVNGSDDVARFFDGDTYIQHNSGIADGVSGLLAAGKAFAAQGVKAQFTGIHRILGEGNFVLAVSEGHVGDGHISFFDLYRVEDGKLAEHWDILETIASDAAAKNGNGKF